MNGHVCGGLFYLEVFHFPILFQQKPCWSKLFQDKNSCVESLILMPAYCIGDSLTPRSITKHDNVVSALACFVNFSSTSTRCRQWCHLSASNLPSSTVVSGCIPTVLTIEIAIVLICKLNYS